jgi:beta-mannosidase
MSTISLDGTWNLYHYAEDAYSILHPDDLASSGLVSIPAQVPGNVELDLERAGELPGIFHGTQIHHLRSLETHTWWLTRTFNLPKKNGQEPWDLVCEGLDTLATVWINGVQVGQSANMLVEQRFAASAALKPGEENTIAVRLASPLNAARQYQYDASTMSWELREEGLHIRKAAHMWGWDIMPRAVSAGIWRPIRLETRPEHAIEQVYYWTKELTPAGAVLGVRFQFRTSHANLDGFSLSFHGVCGEHSFEYEYPVEFIAGGCTIRIPGARLWWPSGFGAANLYEVTAELRYHGQTLAERVERVGLRQILVDRTERAGQAWEMEPAASLPARLDTAPDLASHFVVYVNHQPVAIRGTNWVPLDAFHSRDAWRLDQALGLAEELGCNMLRCWGGNVYENDRFFDLCDEKGILVWQDFAFACCRYPQDEAFLAKVQAEAGQVIKRLRNHACLAIWCGDNEIDMTYLSDGINPENNRLTRQVIPQAIQRHDPQRAYVPSSPYTPPSIFGQPDAWRLTPEQHLWGPRGYYKSPFYTRHSAHFIGEIGYHGCPNVSSIRRFISPDHLWPWQDNEEWHAHDVYHWRHRAVDRDRIRLMANQVKELFGAIPDNLEDFALASQVTQAEAVKFFIESTRLRKWQTSGILWWNLIDGWPQFSDAVVDYYFGKKLAFHYIQRSQAPVCVMIGEAGSGKYLPVVACNDTLQPAEVHFWVTSVGDLGGRGQESLVIEGAGTIPANQNWQVGQIRTYASDQRLYLIKYEVDGHPLSNHYLAGLPPFSLEVYRGWLKQIAALSGRFKAEETGK